MTRTVAIRAGRMERRRRARFAAFLPVLLTALFIWTVGGSVGTAQEKRGSADSTEITALPKGGGPVEKKNEKDGEGGYRMSKSPTLALLFGIVPGGGQLYTEQYWKVPMFALPLGTLIGFSIYNTSRYNDYADQLQGMSTDDTRYAYLRSLRETYRDRRDLTIALTAGVYLLSLIDAYVGAHLFDFDVDDELSGAYLFPDAGRGGLGLGVRW